MTRFLVDETPIAGVFTLTRKRFGDERGYLERMFDQQELHRVLGTGMVRQVIEPSHQGDGHRAGTPSPVAALCGREAGLVHTGFRLRRSGGSPASLYDVWAMVRARTQR